MPVIGKECGACGRYYRLTPEQDAHLSCPHCQGESVQANWETWNFSSCPYCECRQFYRRKDFNQVLGCLIIVVGAALMPFTYGISLPVLLLVDWLLYRNVRDMGVCYRCRAEFRDFESLPETVRPFDHHTGELYETPGEVGS